MSSLEDRLARDPEPWKPKPGDVLVGKVVSITEGEAGYGPYPLLEVEADDGAVRSVHAFHTVLKNELARLRPRPGERLGILYKGKIGDNRYESYRVAVERDDEFEGRNDVDWDRVAQESASELGDRPNGVGDSVDERVDSTPSTDVGNAHSTDDDPF